MPWRALPGRKEDTPKREELPVVEFVEKETAERGRWRGVEGADTAGEEYPEAEPKLGLRPAPEEDSSRERPDRGPRGVTLVEVKADVAAEVAELETVLRWAGAPGGGVGSTALGS